MNRYGIRILIWGACLWSGLPGGLAQQAYEQHLVGWWSFDDDRDTLVKDHSGNEHHGTSYQLTYHDAPEGRFARFDSPSDRVIIPARGKLPPEGISSLTRGSISVWFRYRDPGDGNILPVFYFGEKDTGTPHNSLIIEIGHGRKINNRRLYFTIVNQRFCFDSGRNLSENRWYHFVAVVSDSSNSGYLNGEPMTGRHYNLGSDSTYHDFFSDVPDKELMSFGYGRYGQEDPFFTFRGDIDEIRIYDRVLTGDEVSALYREEYERVNGPIPDHADIPYGPFKRNVLDIWLAESEDPAPLVVYIHGGGFVHNSKESARTGSNYANLQKCLAHGVSFAAINYRYSTTTRLDTILFDCARAIQFLRYRHKEWNIDPSRIAAYGGSAGGGASLWLAVHDDLCDPASNDPVLRQSSHLVAAGHLNSQASYDCEKWAGILQIPASWMEDMDFHDYLDFYRVNTHEEVYRPEIIALREELDMPAMMDAADAPLYLHNIKPDVEPLDRGQVIHHPRHARYLKARADSVNLEGILVTEEVPEQERMDMLDFFFGKFFAMPANSGAMEISDPHIRILPNPVVDEMTILTGTGIHKVVIHNLVGQAVYRSDQMLCRAGKKTASRHMDLSGLKEGIYLLTINDIWTTRFIKVR